MSFLNFYSVFGTVCFTFRDYWHIFAIERLLFNLLTRILSPNDVRGSFTLFHLSIPISLFRCCFIFAALSHSFVDWLSFICESMIRAPKNHFRCIKIDNKKRSENKSAAITTTQMPTPNDHTANEQTTLQNKCKQEYYYKRERERETAHHSPENITH